MKNLLDIQQFQQYDSIELIANQVVEGFITGLHRSPFHGFSVEFAEHRIYNAGESTKHIDWKLYARTEKLYVKKYEEETNLRCQIVIDTSSSMLFPYPDQIYNKLAFSAYSAASLIYLLKRQRDSVGLTLFDEQVNFHTDAHLTTIHMHRLFSELIRLIHSETELKNQPLNNKTNIIDSLHQIAENIHKRSLVVIFSDMLDHSNYEKVFEALQHLKYNKHEVVLFHVIDKQKETDFEFENRPYKFIDLETGQSLKIKPNQIKDHYTKEIKSFFNELRYKCLQYHIDLFEADINEDFSKILMAYFIKRNKLF